MNLLCHLTKFGILAIFLSLLPAQIHAQCSGAWIPFNNKSPRPIDQQTYTISDMPPDHSVTWEVDASFGRIISGQGTPAIVIEWDFTKCNGTCTAHVSAALTAANGSCIDVLGTYQTFRGFSTSLLAEGATTPHAGDTCWYRAGYLDGLSAFPSGWFNPVTGGTVIDNFSNNNMGSAAVTYAVEHYIQVKWGAQGPGTVPFVYWDGISQPPVPSTTVLNVNIGPPGNIDPKVSGPTHVCLDDTAVYTAEWHPGSSYQWSLDGGIIDNGQGTSQVTVLFPAGSVLGYGGQASIVMVETNALGQSASTHKQIIHFNPFLAHTTLLGPRSVCNNSQTTYIASAVGDVFNWTLTGGGTIVSGQGTDTLVVQWPFFGGGTANLALDVTNNIPACTNLSVNTDITFGAGIATYPQIIAPATASLGSTVTYATPANTGHTYNWNVSAGGTLVSGQGTNSIQVQWNTPGPQTVTISEAGPGCGLLTQTAPINVLGFVVEVSANDSTLQTGYGPQQCATLTASATPVPANPSYLWSTGATTPSITVCPTATATHSVTITDATLGQANDDVLIEVENLACGSNGGVTICRNLGMFSFSQCVSPILVPFYLGQGSTLGACPSKTSPQAPESYFFEVAPNPSAGHAEVTLAISDAGMYTVDLFDLEGRLVKAVWKGDLKAGDVRKMNIEGGEHSKGMYFLTLQGPGIRKLKKWILQ